MSRRLRLRFQRKCGGVSVVELLVVVAILALLAVVAVPNWLEARVASDVAGVKADFAALETGLEVYKADQGAYVYMNNGSLFMVPPSKDGQRWWRVTMERLTTPVSYLNGAAPFWDPFDGYAPPLSGSGSAPWPYDEDTFKQYNYIARDGTTLSRWDDETTATWFLLHSPGPGRRYAYIAHEIDALRFDNARIRGICCDLFYDPTNGLTSAGGLWGVGGDPQGPGKVFADMITERDSSRVAEWREME